MKTLLSLVLVVQSVLCLVLASDPYFAPSSETPVNCESIADWYRIPHGEMTWTLNATEFTPTVEGKWTSKSTIENIATLSSPDQVLTIPDYQFNDFLRETKTQWNGKYYTTSCSGYLEAKIKLTRQGEIIELVYNDNILRQYHKRERLCSLKIQNAKDVGHTSFILGQPSSCITHFTVNRKEGPVANNPLSKPEPKKKPEEVTPEPFRPTFGVNKPSENVNKEANPRPKPTFAPKNGGIKKTKSVSDMIREQAQKQRQ